MNGQLPSDRIQRFNDLFAEAGNLLNGVLIIHGQPVRKLSFWKRRKARKAIRMYRECLKIDPDHWQSFWLMGKAYQALGESSRALENFTKAVELEDENPDVPREASISAMNCGEVDASVKYSAEALRRKPGDAGLMSNHALNLLVKGDDDEAKKWIIKAIEADPEDPVNQHVQLLIQEVREGVRPRPTWKNLT